MQKYTLLVQARKVAYPASGNPVLEYPAVFVSLC